MIMIIMKARKKLNNNFTKLEPIDKNQIFKLIDKQIFSFEFFDSIDSTNKKLKEDSKKDIPEWSVYLAEHQTNGKGRLDRSFYSPAGAGIYMSLLIRPKISAPELLPESALLFTVCAAVAVMEAISEVTGKKADIKWVNDIYINGKKVCGILSEGSLSPENDRIDSVIIGIGINVFNCGFDRALSSIADSLYKDNCDIAFIREKLIASILTKIYNYYTNEIAQYIKSPDFIKKYKNSMFLYGKTVTVCKSGDEKNALVTGLTDDCALMVEYPDGTQEALTYGEVRIIPK